MKKECLFFAIFFLNSETKKEIVQVKTLRNHFDLYHTSIECKISSYLKTTLGFLSVSDDTLISLNDAKQFLEERLSIIKK
jgi:hypothetical protein